MAKVIELKDLVVRIEALEAEIKTLKGIKTKPVKKAGVKAEVKPAAPTDIKRMLKELEEAKKAGDKKLAFKTRVKLRKGGYSLRTENGKKYGKAEDRKIKK